MLVVFSNVLFCEVVEITLYEDNWRAFSAPQSKSANKQSDPLVFEVSFLELLES